MTRLLVVATGLGVGGTERHLLAVLPRLRAHGFAPRIACLRSGGALAPDFAAAGIEVTELGDGGGLPGAVRAVPRLRAWLSRERPAIAHFFLPEAYLLGGLATLGLGGLVRVMSRRSLNRYQRHHPLAARVEGWLHRRMDAVLANSAAVAAELRAEGAPPDRLHVIANGLVFAAGGDRAATRAALGLAPDTLAIVVVANLIAYKGHADLLAALAAARARLPGSWVLLCVGRDDGIGADLAARAEAAGLAAQVRFLGQRDDVPDLLAASDIAVSASHEEGSSNAVLEAMAAGLGVVATDAGGNAEAIRPGIDGLLVPPRDPAALGAALVALAGDAGLRARLGDAARARATRDFSLTACVDRYAALYRGLLARKATP
jgi:glycosyltransferase involved in cell wall biosynthesis